MTSRWCLRVWKYAVHYSVPGSTPSYLTLLHGRCVICLLYVLKNYLGCWDFVLRVKHKNKSDIQQPNTEHWLLLCAWARKLIGNGTLCLNWTAKSIVEKHKSLRNCSELGLKTTAVDAVKLSLELKALFKKMEGGGTCNAVVEIKLLVVVKPIRQHLLAEKKRFFQEKRRLLFGPRFYKKKLLQVSKNPLKQSDSFCISPIKKPLSKVLVPLLSTLTLKWRRTHAEVWDWCQGEKMMALKSVWICRASDESVSVERWWRKWRQQRRQGWNGTSG